MAKLMHPATLICNGEIIASGVSFNKALAAAEKIAGVSFQKGAARRRIKFYKGFIYRFDTFNISAKNGLYYFAIVPEHDHVIFTQTFHTKDGVTYKDVTPQELLAKFWAAPCVKYAKHPGRCKLTDIAVFLLIGNFDAASWAMYGDYFMRGHLCWEVEHITDVLYIN